MAQPDLIPMPFAENATPGTIEPIPATTPTVPQDATWSAGFPQVTMQPLASGGIPPRGQNFNGVLNALSQHIFHTQGGGQYKWDDAHGPYSIDDVLQSDDGLRSYVSVVDNNTDNFNTNPSAIGTSWLPWSGGGKVDTTTQINTGAGLTGGGDLSANRTLAVNFATTAQAQALTADNVALTPKKLGDAMNAHVLGMGQSWQNLSGSRSLNTVYTNTSGRTIFVACSGTNVASGDTTSTFEVDGLVVSANTRSSVSEPSTHYAVVPPGSTYSFEVPGNTVLSWWRELR